MYKTLELSSKIKMIVSDFDGIFTDSTVYILNDATKIKKVSYKDLMGISLAVKNGLKVAIISGEKSPEIDYIAERFGLVDIYQDIRLKAPILQDIMSKYGYSDDEIAYIGDDVNDIGCLQQVKYAITVNDANYKVKQLEHIQIAQAPAGYGVFREVVDNILELRQLG